MFNKILFVILEMESMALCMLGKLLIPLEPCSPGLLFIFVLEIESYYVWAG
jgi:hypothetical protein